MASGPLLDHIERSTLATRVAAQIRASVLDGAFKPGSQLNEIALAEQLGTSRGPIREALQALVQEGLLTREPHRGVFVRVITDDDIADIYRAREAIEGAGIKHIILAETGTSIRATLEDIVSQMEEAAAAEEWARVAELDMRFHSEVVRGAQSPRLSRMYTTLIDETRLCLMMNAATPARVNLVDEHRQLATLLHSPDPAPALEALRFHMASAVESLRQD